MASLQGNCILTGDLNCKNVFWGSTKNDTRGIELLESLNQLNLITHNDDSKTRCDPVSGKEESLDVVISNMEAARLFKEFWVGYDIGSDHYPMHVTLQFNNPPRAVPRQTRKVQKLNTVSWNKHLKAQPPLPRSTTATELEQNAEAITARIKEAFDKCCPLTTIKRKPKCRFSAEIEAKVKEKRRLQRLKNEASWSQDALLTRQIMTQINKLGNEIKRLQKEEQKKEGTGREGRLILFGLKRKRED